MARLPIPGSDDGTWGDILNEFLQESLNADGTVKDGVVTTDTIPDASITGDKLAATLDEVPTAAADIDAGSNKITNVDDPTADQDVATKAYVDTEVAGAALADGDKGDVTVSASGATWTIDNGAVSYDKMQDVSATNRLLGRSRAGLLKVRARSLPASTGHLPVAMPR